MNQSVTYDEWLKAFGSRLRDARGSSLQSTIAEAAGLDQGGYSRLERGKQGFNSVSLWNVAKACRVEPYMLLGGYPAPRGSHLSSEALRIAAQWDKMDAAQQEKFRTVMALVTQPVPDAVVAANGFVRPDLKRASKK